MDDQKIRQLILEKAPEKRIACSTALKIARDAGVAPMKIGQLLNEMEIKIQSCQLGCFE